jgi:Tol biopolymer transport system component
MPTHAQVAAALLLALAALPQNSNAQPTSGHPVAAITPFSTVEPISGAISPDGRTFAYEAAEWHQHRIWLLDLISGTNRLLTPAPGDRTGIAWSADGRAIAYSGSVTLPDLGTPVRGLWVVDVRTGREQLAFNRGGNGVDSWPGSPVWTADGRILFLDFEPRVEPAARNDSGRRPRLYALSIVRPDGTDAHQLTSEVGAVLPSADGARLAYVGPACNGTAPALGGLWIRRTADTVARCIADVRLRARPTAWSSDGTVLYLLSPPPARSDSLSTAAYAVTLPDGTGPAVIRRLDPDSGDVHGLSVAADGSAILSLYRARTSIAILPSGGGTPTVLDLDAQYSAAFPLWSVDTRALAFLDAPWPPGSRPGGRQRVVSIDANGRAFGPIRTADSVLGRERPVASRGDSAWHGAWAPVTGCFAWTVPRNRFPIDDVRMSSAAPSEWPRFTRNADYYTGARQFNGYQIEVQWSADGRRMLGRHYVGYTFVRDIGPNCFPRGQSRHLVYSGYDGWVDSPRLAPNGASVAFIAQVLGSELRGTSDSAGLFVASVDSGSPHLVAPFRPEPSLGGPTWSPDGHWLYYSQLDSANHGQLLRIATDGSSGPPLQLTQGTMSLIQPDASPDGRWLAATIWQGGTTLWRVPSTDSAVAPITPVAVDLSRRTVAVSEVDAGLMDLARRVADGASEWSRMWPGYWSPSRPFFIVDDDRGTRLYVGTQCPFPAFDSVVGQLPASLAGRLYLSRGAWRAEPGLFNPALPIAEVSAANRDSLTVPAVRERVLYQLFALAYRSEGEHAWWENDDPTPRPPSMQTNACPAANRSACLALLRFERVLLIRAYDSPESELRHRVAQYVALRWLDKASVFGWRHDPDVERHLSLGVPVAHHAAAVAAGSSPSVYLSDLRQRLADTVRDTRDPMPRDRLGVTGEGAIALLDRLRVPWHDSARAGHMLDELLARAVRFDSTTVLSTVRDAMAAENFPAILEATKRELGDTLRLVGAAPDASFLNQYLLRGLYARDWRAAPIQIDVPKLTTDSAVTLDIDAGHAGVLTPGPGYVIAPDPRHVTIRLHGTPMTIRGVPVAIDPAPPGAHGVTRILIFAKDQPTH